MEYFLKKYKKTGSILKIKNYKHQIWWFYIYIFINLRVEKNTPTIIFSSNYMISHEHNILINVTFSDILI
jgi:hypothetical protein